MQKIIDHTPDNRGKRTVDDHRTRNDEHFRTNAHNHPLCLIVDGRCCHSIGKARYRDKSSCACSLCKTVKYTEARRKRCQNNDGNRGQNPHRRFRHPQMQIQSIKSFCQKTDTAADQKCGNTVFRRRLFFCIRICVLLIRFRIEIHDIPPYLFLRIVLHRSFAFILSPSRKILTKKYPSCQKTQRVNNRVFYFSALVSQYMQR